MTASDKELLKEIDDKLEELNDDLLNNHMLEQLAEAEKNVREKIGDRIYADILRLELVKRVITE